MAGSKLVVRVILDIIDAHFFRNNTLIRSVHATSNGKMVMFAGRTSLLHTAINGKEGLTEDAYNLIFSNLQIMFYLSFHMDG